MLWFLVEFHILSMRHPPGINWKPTQFQETKFDFLNSKSDFSGLKEREFPNLVKKDLHSTFNFTHIDTIWSSTPFFNFQKLWASTFFLRYTRRCFFKGRLKGTCPFVSHSFWPGASKPRCHLVFNIFQFPKIMGQYIFRKIYENMFSQRETRGNMSIRNFVSHPFLTRSL